MVFSSVVGESQPSKSNYLRRLAVPDAIFCLAIAEYCALALALCAACKSMAELLLKSFLLPESKIMNANE